MTTSTLRRRTLALTAGLLCAAAAPAMAAATTAPTMPDDTNTTGDTRPFEADNGTVEIPVDPQRIVALGSAGVYLSLGVEPVGLGPTADPISELAWLPPEATEANDAAVDVGEPADYEQIASLEPDLIVVYEPAHVWTPDRYDEERLQSIAPTVYIELNSTIWEAQVERLADAVGELDAFEADKAQYDSLVAEIQERYADLLDATTFSFLNNWGTEGEFAFDYPNSYCTAHATAAGVTVLPTAPTPEDDGPSASQSIEGLGDFVEGVDVLIYPLVADGTVKPAFESVLESNIWQSLPQVVEGRALGVKCSTIFTYPIRIALLESLEEALATLSEAG